jgi:hypothetical protein
MFRNAIHLFRITTAMAALLTSINAWGGNKADTKWPPHDTTRPKPPIITPGTSSSQEAPGRVPSDAIVLFDGKSLDGWQSAKEGPAKWRLADGFMETGQKAGDIQTKEKFGDCQLHVEYSTPTPPKGTDQGRGNSGIFLMGLYEVQVLDNYDNPTYADGTVSAIYGQHPPQVNASRPPGQWQTYDIVFHRPRFDNAGKVIRPATFTVFLNGVLTQDNVEATGPTTWKARPPYKAHSDKLPLQLQDHGNPVRFRNIWYRPIPEGE